jgi:hypothetical protein
MAGILKGLDCTFNASFDRSDNFEGVMFMPSEILLINASTACQVFVLTLAEDNTA